MDDSLKLSIVLPCYNELGNLPRIYAVLSEILQAQPGVEVLLVNNGSTDNCSITFMLTPNTFNSLKTDPA